MTAELEPKVSAPDSGEAPAAQGGSRLDAFLWPRWLPARLRMPVVAQVTGAVALTALLIGPWWARIPSAPVPQSAAVPRPAAVPLPAPVRQVPPQPVARAPREAGAPSAHLNLEVRHSFSTVALSVSVDGKTALETTLEGSGKRFKVFGKRAERGFTKTLELTPGVRLVKVRVTSAADKFDQTRVERFELEPSTVAAMQISADRSGLSIKAERPPAPARISAAPPAAVAAPAPVPAAVERGAPSPAGATPARQDAAASADMLQSMRSMLIAIAGFVASTATAFVIQEFLRSRKALLFDDQNRRRRKAPSL
jgi:hypothetical protein